MSMIKDGCNVQLKPQVNNVCPTGRDDNKTSTVESVFEDGSVRMDRDLGGCRWWNVEDLMLAHSIPLETLVEVVNPNVPECGIRLFVVGHNYRVDGTPVYVLSTDPKFVDEYNNDQFTIDTAMEGYSRGVNDGKMTGGFVDDDLSVII